MLAAPSCLHMLVHRHCVGLCQDTLRHCSVLGHLSSGLHINHSFYSAFWGSSLLPSLPSHTRHSSGPWELILIIPLHLLPSCSPPCPRLWQKPTNGPAAFILSSSLCSVQPPGRASSKLLSNHLLFVQKHQDQLCISFCQDQRLINNTVPHFSCLSLDPVEARSQKGGRWKSSFHIYF